MKTTYTCPQLVEIFATQMKNPGTYRKKDKTLLRLPSTQEVGTTLVTYVQGDEGVRFESETKIKSSDVIARNPDPLSNGAFNEWPIPYRTVIDTYGDIFSELGFQFYPFQKQASISAIEMTEEMFKSIGANEMVLTYTHNGQSRFLNAGDFLTVDGYGISASNMKNYEKV
jgi:hypothetical protein